MSDKYKNGKIYTIRHKNDDSLIYVGSTVQPLFKRWYVCMYVYTYVCMYVCKYIQSFMYVCVCACMYIYIRSLCM